MSFNPCSLIAALPPFDADTPSTFAGYADFCQRYPLHFDALSASSHLGQIALHGEQIAVHLFRPPHPRGSLVIVHGYLDHHGLYHHLIRYGLEQDLNVLCFDLPGHGLSSGVRASIDSFEQYQTLFQALLGKLDDWQLCGPLHLLGQSTGGAIINHFLLTQRAARSPEIDGQIVLLAPLVRPARWHGVRLAHALLSPWKATVKREFAPNSHDPVFNAFLALDPLQSPVITTAWVGAMKRWLAEFETLPGTSAYQPLLVQGQQDATVDWRYNLPLLQQKFPRLQTLLIPTARHQLANESAPIRSQYLGWLEQQGFGQPPSLEIITNKEPY